MPDDILDSLEFEQQITAMNNGDLVKFGARLSWETNKSLNLLRKDFTCLMKEHRERVNAGANCSNVNILPNGNMPAEVKKWIKYTLGLGFGGGIITSGFVGYFIGKALKIW